MTELDITYYIARFPGGQVRSSESEVSQIVNSLLPHCPNLTSLNIHVTVDWRKHEPGGELPHMCMETLFSLLPVYLKQQLKHLSVEGRLILTSTCVQRLIKPLTAADFTALEFCTSLTQLKIGTELVRPLPWDCLPSKLNRLCLHEISVNPNRGTVSSRSKLQQIILSGSCSASDAVCILESFPKLQHLSIKRLSAPITVEGLRHLERIMKVFQPIDGCGATVNSIGNSTRISNSVNNLLNGTNNNIDHDSLSQPVGLLASELVLTVPDAGQPFHFSSFLFSTPPMHDTLAVTIQCSLYQMHLFDNVEKPCLSHLADVFPNLCKVTFVDCPLLDNDLTHLQLCTHLQALHLSQCYNVTGMGITQFACDAQNVLVLEAVNCRHVNAHHQATLHNILNPRRVPGGAQQSGPLTKRRAKSSTGHRPCPHCLGVAVFWGACLGLSIWRAGKLLRGFRHPISRRNAALSVCELGVIIGLVFG